MNFEFIPGTHSPLGFAITIGAMLVIALAPVSYTHLRAHETVLDLVCRLLLEKKKTEKIAIRCNHVDSFLMTTLTLYIITGAKYTQ